MSPSTQLTGSGRVATAGDILGTAPPVRFRVSSTLDKNGKPLHGARHSSLSHRRYLHIETLDGLATLAGFLTAEEFAYVMQALFVEVAS